MMVLRTPLTARSPARSAIRGPSHLAPLLPARRPVFRARATPPGPPEESQERAENLPSQGQPESPAERQGLDPLQVPFTTLDKANKLPGLRRSPGMERSTAPTLQQKLTYALSFDGPLPELTNGRLAMLGFLAAMGAELGSGTPVLQQLSIATWPVIFVVIALIVASIVPVLGGYSLKERYGGPWHPQAELLNVRLAMAGLVGLVVTELITGASVFPKILG